MARVKDNTLTLYHKTDGENTGYDHYSTHFFLSGLVFKRLA